MRRKKSSQISCGSLVEANHSTANSRRIYTTFILGTALLNFGTRASKIGHGTLDFCRVKANFSARVPKTLGGPRPPQEVVSARLKRGPRAETGGILVPRIFALMTDHEGEGSGVENELLRRQNLELFAGRKIWRRKIVATFASGATMPQKC